jgi:hypothetical protein
LALAAIDSVGRDKGRVLACSLGHAALIAPDAACDSGQIADDLGFFRPRIRHAYCKTARPRERAGIAHRTPN